MKIEKKQNMLMSVWDRRKEILYGNWSVGDVIENNPTPECEVNDTEWYDGWAWVIYLLLPCIYSLSFIYYYYVLNLLPPQVEYTRNSLLLHNFIIYKISTNKSKKVIK